MDHSNTLRASRNTGFLVPLLKRPRNRRGGNSILERIEEHCEGRNLHADWDAIPASLGTSADEAMLNKARTVAKTTGPAEGFAVAWASDTVKAAHSAFEGLTFTGACN